MSCLARDPLNTIGSISFVGEVKKGRRVICLEDRGVIAEVKRFAMLSEESFQFRSCKRFLRRMFFRINSRAVHSCPSVRLTLLSPAPRSFVASISYESSLRAPRLR